MAEVLHAYVEQNTAQTTTSATPAAVSGCTISGASLDASTKYLLLARYQYKVNNFSNKSTLYIASADDADLAVRTRAVTEHASTSDHFSQFTVQQFTTDASPADVELFAAVDGSSTLTVDQFSMILIDLDDLGSDNYFDDTWDPGTEIPASPATAGLTLPNSTIGKEVEFVVFAGGRVEVGSTSRYLDTRLSSGETGGLNAETSDKYKREGEDAGEEVQAGFWGRHLSQAGSGDANGPRWSARQETTGGNHYLQDVYVIAIKAEAFADFTEDYTASGGSVTSETTVATATSYTPTTGGNHLVLGKATKNVGNTKMKLWVEDGTTEIRTGDSAETHGYVWDTGNDQLPGHTMQRISITAEKTYNLQQSMSASEDSDYIGLAVLNLNLASAGGTDATPTPADLVITSTFPAVTAVGEVNATTTLTALAVTSTVDAVTAVVVSDATTVLTAIAATTTFDPVTTVNDVNATTVQTALAPIFTFDTVTTLGEISATATAPDAPFTVTFDPAVAVGETNATATCTTLVATVTFDPVTAVGEVNAAATVTALTATATFDAVTTANDVNAVAPGTALAGIVTFPVPVAVGEVNDTASLTTLAATSTFDAVTATGSATGTAILTAITATSTFDPVTAVGEVNTDVTATTLPITATFDSVATSVDTTVTTVALTATSTFDAVTATGSTTATATPTALAATAVFDAVTATGETHATATPTALAVTGTFDAVTTVGMSGATASLTTFVATSTFGTVGYTIDSVAVLTAAEIQATYPFVVTEAGASATLTALDVGATFPDHDIAFNTVVWTDGKLATTAVAGTMTTTKTDHELVTASSGGSLKP